MPSMRCFAKWASMKPTATRGRMYYTVENHVKHLGEAKAGEPLYVTTQVLASMTSACMCFIACIAAATTS